MEYSFSLSREEYYDYKTEVKYSFKSLLFKQAIVVLLLLILRKNAITITFSVCAVLYDIYYVINTKRRMISELKMYNIMDNIVVAFEKSVFKYICNDYELKISNSMISRIRECKLGYLIIFELSGINDLYIPRRIVGEKFVNDLLILISKKYYKYDSEYILS